MWFVLFVLSFLLGSLCWSVYKMMTDFSDSYVADKVERGVDPAMLEVQPPTRKLQID